MPRQRGMIKSAQVDVDIETADFAHHRFHVSVGSQTKLSDLPGAVAEAIKRGSALFTQRAKEGFEGFEIWARDRVVARFPELDRPSGDQGSKDGKAGKSSSPKGKHNAPVPRPSGMSGAAWSPALSR